MVGVPQMCDPYHGLRLMRVVGRVHMFWARVCDTPLMAVVARAGLTMHGTAQRDANASQPLLFQQGDLALHVRASCGYGQTRCEENFVSSRTKTAPLSKPAPGSLCCKDFMDHACMTACFHALLWDPGVFCCLLCFGVVLSRRRCLHRNI